MRRASARSRSEPLASSTPLSSLPVARSHLAAMELQARRLKAAVAPAFLYCKVGPPPIITCKATMTKLTRKVSMSTCVIGASASAGAHPFALQDNLLHRTSSILISGRHGALLVAYLSVM